jgi:formylglycine-generating enzyme required for sulfatase activity
LVPTNNIVKFNGIKADVLSASTEKLVVKVPEGPTRGYITIENSRGSDKSKSIFEYSNQTITSMVTINIGDFLMGTPSLSQINKVIEIINDTSKVSIGANDTLNDLTDTQITNIANYTGIKKDVLVFAKDNSSSNKLLTKFLEELVSFTYKPYADKDKINELINNPANIGATLITTLNDFNNNNAMIKATANYIKSDENHLRIIAKNDDSSKLLVLFLKELRDNQAVLGPSQSPMIKVFVSPFDIDKTEVTNKEYRKFIEAGAYNNQDFWTAAGWQWKTLNNINQPMYWNDSRFNQDNQPVVGVSWYEASAYAKWAGKRLPTEAEWESVARYNNKTNTLPWGRLYPWGNSLPIEYDNNNNVTSKRANGFFGQDGYDDGYKFLSQTDIFSTGKTKEGIADLAGNALEWTSDWYDISYYGRTSNFSNPVGPVSGNFKVVRGGAWNNSSSEMRTYFREQYFRPESRSFNIGFRCVK